MFSYAITHGWLRRDTNPWRFLPKWVETSRERVLSLEELGAVWREAPQVNTTFGRIMRLLILSGCRKSEISDLRWSEVGLDEAVIRLPGSRTKNKRPHLVPLAPAAVEILAGGAAGLRPAGVRQCRLLVQDEASTRRARGLKEPWVIHDSGVGRDRAARARRRRHAPGRADHQPRVRQPGRRRRRLRPIRAPRRAASRAGALGRPGAARGRRAGR